MSLRQPGRQAIRVGVFALVIVGSAVAGSAPCWGVAGTVWTTLPSMPTPRDQLAAATAPCPAGQKASCVYVVGGLNDGGLALPTVESYNAADNTWTTLAPMLTGRDGPAAAAAPCPSGQSGTCVYAMGGFTETPFGASATVESYNPSTNAWSADASMPTARDFLAAAAAPCPSGQTGTCVYSVGGETSAGVTATAESYNPSTNAWSTDAPLPTARQQLAAAPAACPAGQTGTCVYAVGGDSVTGGELATNESYNPITNAWTTLTPMPTPRFEVAVATSACPAGETGSCIYVAGGADAGNVLSTLQAFDPPLARHGKNK